MKHWILIWWFAAISASGEFAFFDYRDETTCNLMKRGYERSHIKTTTCLSKEGDPHGRIHSNDDRGRV